ncbi:dehydrogenase/reductase SDR family member 7-like [Saccoglossus kowalevskii]|uniref:Dehydrogenase/reductase SDR family member 7-like n=1 Tax=Saccoglossus kowalevskii TaxID=10224 RepID=A0ABM0MAI7_SACKO|nr:PREDICTED: dehydrogenase/reductase SDR family member 7-like [Saccoglossus kowalevskii]
MNWMETFGWLVGILILVFVIACLLSDADLTLRFFEKVGSKKGEDFRNQVIWVTGASSGIGEELAYQLAKTGCKLVLSARRKNELQRVKDEILKKGGIHQDDVMVLPLDIAECDTHKDATEKVISQFKQIDILVNNAGRSQRSLAMEASFEVDKAIFDINILGTISLTKSVLPYMVSRKSGHVVVTSSLAGIVPAPLQTAYSAAKHAVQGYFNSLRLELASDNITLTTILPGPVVSKVVENALTTSLDKGLISGNMEAAMQYPNRMSTVRCAELMVIAIAYQLHEVWIAKNPILLTAYMAQYMPTTCRFFLAIYAKRRIKSLKDNTPKKKDE